MTASRSSDTEVIRDLGDRIREVRLSRNVTRKNLAREAGVSLPTIVRMESGQSSSTASLVRVLRALNMLENLEQLVPRPLPSPIDRVKLEGRKRKRASG